MHGFADGYFVSENELVKEMNLYLARLNLAAATLRHVESLNSPIPPAVYSAAVELKNFTGMEEKRRKTLYRVGRDSFSTILKIIIRMKFVVIRECLVSGLPSTASYPKPL